MARTRRSGLRRRRRAKNPRRDLLLPADRVQLLPQPLRLQAHRSCGVGFRRKRRSKTHRQQRLGALVETSHNPVLIGKSIAVNGGDVFDDPGDRDDGIECEGDEPITADAEEVVDARQSVGERVEVQHLA
jgi:hypothetical protein